MSSVTPRPAAPLAAFVRRYLVAAWAIAGLAAGGAAAAAGEAGLARVVWSVTTGVALVPLVAATAVSLRARRVGVDAIALVAMGAALAVGEPLAGAVVALMMGGGQALEAFAAGRAQRELVALLDRAPRHAHRFADGQLVTVPIEQVAAGDRLLVKPGETVPVDGRVECGVAVLDESALTGESRPVERQPGEAVASGGVNVGGPLELRATASAERSTYAGIVRMVLEARTAKAPFVRLADRYAALLLPVALAVAGAAWAYSGDARRALAVMVVATPCPLILAAPVAILGGLSRCARRGVLVKGGRALEALARARVALLDKTGTLTTGRPRVAEIALFGDLPAADLLRLAAGLDQVSPHVYATALVAAARERELALALPTSVAETPGSGIRGRLEGREVALGGLAWLVEEGAASPQAAAELRLRASRAGDASVFVAVDGRVAGAIVLEDPVREDAAATVERLRRAGIERVVLLTGDQAEVAERVGAAIGADRVLAGRTPAQKVAAVVEERARGVTLMVGDGVNDAPALAAADVGVALGARGETAAVEAADAVLTVDRIERLGDAIEIARRTRGIALQSVVAGMALSFAAMAFAALGRLAPVPGALVQEAIDVAVILWALRALAEPRAGARGNPGEPRRAGEAAGLGLDARIASV